LVNAGASDDVNTNTTGTSLASLVTAEQQRTFADMHSFQQGMFMNCAKAKYLATGSLIAFSLAGTFTTTCTIDTCNYSLEVTSIDVSIINLPHCTNR